VYQPYDAEYVEKYYRYKDPDGSRWASQDVAAAGPGPARYFRGELREPPPGSHWRYSQEKIDEYVASGRIYFTENGFPRFKRYLRDMKGVVLQDIWDDKDVQPVVSWSDEGFGYPTQKPIALLDRIIRASSNKGDVVFDPFCGCGTTIYAATQNERNWIGCDIAILAVKLIREHLSEKYHLVEGVHFETDGIPVSVEQADELFKHDPLQFQHWLVEAAGGFPMQKKVADQGVDGRLYFETEQGLQAMVLSVKGGGIRPGDLRDLRGVMDREPETPLSGFLSLKEPTKAMRAEAASCGQWTYKGVKYDRMQLLSVHDLLVDKRELRTPSKVSTRITTGQQSLPLIAAPRRRPKPRGGTGVQVELDLPE
jgi:hypothetical protein